jgi:drug/metabolite transporter (DMT)-like permease
MRSLKGPLGMVAAVCCFSVMAVLAKRCAQLGLSGPEITWYRSFIGLALVLSLWAFGSVRLITSQPVALIFRGVIGGLSLLCLFAAIATIPVADAAFLNNTSPIFATIGGSLFLGEKITPVSIPALFVALSGVYLILQPSLKAIPWGALAGLASGILAGFVIVTVRHLRRTDTSSMIFLSFSLGGLVLSSFWIGSFQRLTPAQIPWLLGMSIAAASAQYLLYYALRYCEASEASTVGLLSPLLTALLGAWLLHEPLTPLGILGGCLIIGGGAIVFWGRRQFAPQVQGPDLSLDPGVRKS